MENLIQEINGVKYLLINDVATSDFNLRMRRERVKEIGGIFQGVNDRQTGWFGDIKQIKYSVLLPLEKVKEW